MRRLLWMNFAPDGAGGGGGNSSGNPAGNTASSAAGAGSASPPPSPPSGGGSGGTPSNAPAAGSGSGTPMQSPPSQSDVTGFRDAARDYGLDLSGFQDDHAAMQHLASQVQALGQLQQLAPYAQAYQQNADAFQQFLQQQAQQQQAQQAQQQKGWWNPPEYNPMWERLISVDPTTGQYVLKPGAPPDILPKFLAHQQYRQQFAEKFLSNPEEALGQMVESRAQKVAQSLIQQHLNQFDEQSYAQNFVRSNSSWLHAHDTNGNVMMDPRTGREQLSDWGQRFLNHVVAAERLGIQGIRNQEQYARVMLDRDFLASQFEGTQANSTNQQIRQNFLNQNNRAPNHSGSIQPPNLNGNNPSQNPSLDLAARLAQAMRQNGVTDNDFRSEPLVTPAA